MRAFTNSLSYAGSPEECASNMRRVTSRRRRSRFVSGEAEMNSGTMAATGASKSRRPRS